MKNTGAISGIGANSVNVSGKVIGDISVRCGLDEEAVNVSLGNQTKQLTQALEAQGQAVTAEVVEALRTLIENKFVEYICNIRAGQANSEESAREAVQKKFKELQDGTAALVENVSAALNKKLAEGDELLQSIGALQKKAEDCANRRYGQFMQWREKRIEAARNNLFREVHREHLNKSDVKKCALVLLELVPDDFLAQFYLAACSANYREAITFLNEIKVDEHAQEELKEVIDYLTKHLRSEWILSASALVERSGSVLGKDENSFRKEIRDPFEREVQKIGKGIYNVIPDGCVFIAYNHDDIAEVSKLIDYLEESPEIRCFAAFRNVRNGLGAEEYNKILHRAMSRCSVFVLYSTYQSRTMGGSFDEMDYIVQDDYNRAERNRHPEFKRRGDYKHLPAEYKKPRIEYLRENYRSNEANNSLAKMFFGDARHRTEPKELKNRILDLLHGCEEETLEEGQKQTEAARLAEEQRKAEEARKAEERRKAEAAAEAARLAEEQRKAEEARRAEERRKAEVAAEAARLAEERRKTEVAAEAARLAEEWRKAEEARRAEERRKAEAARLAEERREAEAVAEAARLAEERRKAEAARKTEAQRKVIRHANGDVFEGELKDGKYNGHGVYRFANGNAYDGEWKNDQRNGHGVYRWANGDVYDGEWKDDKANGHGVFRSVDGYVFEGEWKDDKYNGHGVYRWANGNVYEGEWKDGKYSGHGVYRWANGNVYEGEYKDGIYNGHGVYRWANGDVFEGEYKDGKANGHGVKRCANGNVYEGEYKDSELNGHGVARFANGNVYEGEYKDGIYNGHGVYRYAHGDVYEGEWKNDKCNGHGVYRWANGDVYDGEWKDDKANGHGVKRYANGNVYEGEWEDGNFNGHGVYRWANGDVYDGEHKDGKANGHGVKRCANGNVYEGEYKDSELNGHGVARFANGNVYEGEWKDGKLVHEKKVW